MFTVALEHKLIIPYKITKECCLLFKQVNSYTQALSEAIRATWKGPQAFGGPKPSWIYSWISIKPIIKHQEEILNFL